MLATFFRIIIVMAVFLAGTLVGNIYMPQKKLETSALVSLKEPESAVDLKSSPDTAAAMADLKELNTLLPQEVKDDENVFALNTNIEKTLLLQSYLAAKYKYEIELLRASATPEQRDDFIKARNNYNAITALIQQTYPQIQESEVEILSPAQPAAAPLEEVLPQAAQPAQTASTPQATPSATTAAQPVKSVQAIQATPVADAAKPAATVQTATPAVAASAPISPVKTEKPANNLAGDIPSSK
jgi:hypothetical protein